jgi:hypothetical protein
MARSFRNQAVVAMDHSVTVWAPDLKPGQRVEVILVVDSGEGQQAEAGTSFIDAVAGVEIDAPADYSVKFKDDLYPSFRRA